MRLFIVFLATLTSTWSLQKHSVNHRQTSRIQSLLPISSRKRQSFYRLHVVEHLVSCSDNEVIKDLLGASSEYCLRENIDVIANFKGFSEQIFNIGFLVIAYFTIKRANNRGIREINDLLQDDELDNEDGNSNNQGKITKKRLPKCPQCNGSGKYMWKGETNVLDVCELCDGVGFIDFSTSSTNVQQLPSNLKNNNWIDGDNDENM